MKRPERICANFTNRSWLFRPSQSGRRSLTQSSNRRMLKSMKSLSGPPPRISELPMNMTATIKRVVTRWTLLPFFLIEREFVCEGQQKSGITPFSSQAVLRSASALEGRAANPAAIFLKILSVRTREIRGINQSTKNEPHHIITTRNHQDSCSCRAHLHSCDHTVISW